MVEVSRCHLDPTQVPPNTSMRGSIRRSARTVHTQCIYWGCCLDLSRNRGYVLLGLCFCPKMYLALQKGLGSVAACKIGIGVQWFAVFQPAAALVACELAQGALTPCHGSSPSNFGLA